MKRLLISHIADEDGITPVILANLVFEKLDILLLEPSEVDKKLSENIIKYDEIHIVDLNVSEEMAKKINDNEEVKNKIKIFDHHKSKLDLNKYDFITVIDEENNQKESGTSIYYRYLLTISDNEILHKKVTKDFVNEVRIIDTYDFKTKEDEKTKNLDLLFSILGRENYINYFTKYLKENDKFIYGEKEKYLIKLEQDKLNNYLEQKLKEMFIVKIDNYKVGLVYAEKYRSQLGNIICEKYPDLDYAVIINISKSISFRGKDKVDLSVIAGSLGGGGHKNASGAPLPENLLEKISKLIFPNIEIIKEEKGDGINE